MRRVLLLADVGAVGLVYTLWSTRPLWTDLALLAVLAVVVLLTWQDWQTALPHAVRLPMLAFLGAFVVAAVFAPDQLTAWRSVVGVLAYGLVFAFLGNLMAHGVTRSEMYQGMVLASQVLMAAWLVNWLADGARLIGYRLRFDNTNSAALAVMLLMPALIVGERRRLVTGQSAAVLWLSASRAGALGLAGGVATALWRWRPLARYRPVLVAVGLALGVGLVARGHLFSASDRPQMWGIAVRMVATSPLVGQGPNAYKGWWMQTRPEKYFYGHAHNLYLNLAAETGVIGVAAGAWLAGAVLLALARRGSSPWAVAALAATVALLAHSVGDVPTTAPYITFTWLALVRMGLA